MPTPSQIEAALHSFVGLPLLSMWRVWFQAFGIGEGTDEVNARGREVIRYDFHLHVASPWSLDRDGELVICEADHVRSQPRFYAADAPPKEPELAARWHRAQAFFEAMEAAELMIENVQAEPSGSFALGMKGGYRLSVDCSGAEAGGWRIVPRSEDEPQFVVGDDSQVFGEYLDSL